MATVTGLTAERMLEIEAASIVDGNVDGSGNLILERHDGSPINAGSVIGPAGPTGPVGEDTAILAAVPVLDVGIVNQIRAGRLLFASDFSDMGLSAPIGLWNLGNLLDVSGFGRNLLNKGSVTFTGGINGLATTAAQFIGSTAQALYIADTGGADPFRIRTGTIGCWFRTAKQGVAQMLVSKRAASPQLGYWLRVTAGNVLEFGFSSTGSDSLSSMGLTNVADGRWHFATSVYDGNIHKLYVDGVLEDACMFNLLFFPSSGPFNIGGYAADASTLATEPHFGRVDEAFITSDVLTEDQVRNLFCTKIPHGLGEVPSRVTLNIRRRRKGAALASGDFPSLPLRLYNFSAGSLANEGSDGGAGNLTSAGTIAPGAVNNAFIFANGRLTSSDAGLPAALTARTCGCWIKTQQISATSMYILTWGTTNGTNDIRLNVISGNIIAASGSNSITGPFIADGEWHHIVVIEDDSPIDGVKRKLYVDGRLAGTSLVLNSITLGGAAKFVIGQSLASTLPFLGQIDGVFVDDAQYVFEDVIKIYSKSSQELAPSPKNVGDHVEALMDDCVLAAFDSLDLVSRVDMKVSP
jgi:hypothetical protein